MGEQSAARLEGDRYQHLYSWYEVLQLLDENTKYAFGYVEHPEAGAADDVTLHPVDGSGLPARFVQVKWHVDHRDAYSFDSLSLVVTGTTSLLQKLFRSWRSLSATYGSVEVWLLSNWSVARDLGRWIDGRGHTFSEDFFDAGKRSKARKEREKWAAALGASTDEVDAFCRDLRLRLGYGGVSDLEERVDERMARHGLQFGKNQRATAIDAVKEWIEIGGERKRITPGILRSEITERELWAKHPDEPPVSLYVHGWARRAYDRLPTIELDWTPYFDREERRIASEEVWKEKLLPDLRRARADLSARENSSYVDFRGKLPLSGTLAVGALFPEVAGFTFRAEQPTRGETHLWRSDAGTSTRHFVVRAEDGEPGPNVLIGLAVTGPGWEDIASHYRDHGGEYDSVVYFEPDNGPGDAAVTSAADAVALAVSAKNLIREYRARYRASTLHLIFYGPATLSLFLGQRLNALGRIVTYERTGAGGYQASVILKTG